MTERVFNKVKKDILDLCSAFNTLLDYPDTKEYQQILKKFISHIENLKPKDFF